MARLEAGGGPKPLAGDFVLVGAPVYCGRLPVVAVERFKRFAARGTPAALVVSYGNRAYDDALVEMCDLALEMGLRPVAAGAFIGEHSFSTPKLPLAVGRPDTSDLDAARAFGASVRDKMAAHADPGAAPLAVVPGNRPYREGCPDLKAAPATDPDACLRCGTCAEVCPTGAITVDVTACTKVEDCIHCCACVKACPEGARSFHVPEIDAIRQRLSQNFSTPKPPETFL